MNAFTRTPKIRTRCVSCSRCPDGLVRVYVKRVDVLQTSRHVRVEVNGVEVANTRRAFFLFETGLRRRTYIPVTDVKLELLTPSDTTSVCPYKVCLPDVIGVAHFTDTGIGVGELL